MLSANRVLAEWPSRGRRLLAERLSAPRASSRGLWIVMVGAGAGLASWALHPWQALVIATGWALSPLYVALWPLSGLATMAVSVAGNRYTFTVAGTNLRPEYLAAGAALATWVVLEARKRRKTDLGAPEAWLGAWLALNILASALASPNALQSLRFSGIIAAMVAIYFVAVAVVRDDATLAKAYRLAVVVGAGVALHGLAALILYRYGLDIGMRVDPDTGYPAPKGPLWEPNIFGSYLAATAAMTLSLLWGSRSRRESIFLGAAALLMATGVILSLSRAAWLSLGVGLAAVVWVNTRGSGFRRLAPAAMALVLLTLVGAYQMAGGLSPDNAVARRAESLLQLQAEGSVGNRLALYGMALQGWLQRPILGWGTGSFGLGREFNAQPAWIGNLELHLLYDTGLLGLAVFLGFCLSMAGAAMAALRGAVRQPSRPYIAGLATGMVVLLLAYQTTEGTWLGFTWWYTGLLSAALRIAPGAPTTNHDREGIAP